MRIMLAVIISLFSSGVASAIEEESSPLLAAIQVTETLIIPIAQLSEGVWKPLSFASDKVSMEFKPRADKPWKYENNIAMLSQLTVNGIAGSDLKSWYYAGSNTPLRMSHFIQFGGEFAGHDNDQCYSGWGMAIEGRSGDPDLGFWTEYRQKLLFSRQVDSDAFRENKSEQIGQRVIAFLSPAIEASERRFIREGIERCDALNGSGAIADRSGSVTVYCSAIRQRPELLKQMRPEVQIKVAKAGELSLYYVALEKVYFVEGGSGNPDVTDAQAWFLEKDGSLSLISRLITMTDVNHKDNATRVRPIAVATVEGRTFVFSLDYGMELHAWAIREMADGKLKVLSGELEDGYQKW